MQTKHVTAMALIFGIIFITFIAMVEVKECEDKGQYKAGERFCCQLCPAGKTWIHDCFSDGEESFCIHCSPGKDYMDVVNRDPKCKKCSTCNAHNEVVHQECTLTSDTVCQCNDGYSRPHPSERCAVTPNTDQNVAITAGIVTFMLVIVVVALLRYRKKKSLYPIDDNGTVTQNITFLSVGIDHTTKDNTPLRNVDVLEEPRMLVKNRMNQCDAAVWREFHELLPEVYTFVSVNTLFFLYEMDKKYKIEISMYWKAYAITDISKRAVFMINHFIMEGEEKCQGLLEIIPTRQDKETHLQTLLDHAVKCSPVLNPDTAHNELQISEDLKTATWLEKPPDKPEHTDRFKYWTQVLSSESFNSGCHFWVVNVGNVENLRVGVAYQCIQRKEANSACLIGLNSTSWCLWKYENKYKAWHDKQSTELEVGEHPRRIGVGLDYDKGVLLFYNADNNTHLHTFYSHFSLPLHVALWVWKGVLTVEPVNSDYNWI